MVISHRLVLNDAVLTRDNILLQDTTGATAEDIYRMLKCQYPKFFKMDELCKWAWLGAEALLRHDGPVYADMDPFKTGVVLATAHGCLAVDKRYFDGIAVPSPALFVYTLPNIMLGEICIRHGFKGEQFCMVSEAFDAEEIHFIVTDLMQNKGMDACLCGWVDVAGGKPDVCLYWVTSGQGLEFTAAQLSSR